MATVLKSGRLSGCTARDKKDTAVCTMRPMVQGRTRRHGEVLNDTLQHFRNQPAGHATDAQLADFNRFWGLVDYEGRMK
jgi:hypothetical protein